MHKSVSVVIHLVDMVQHLILIVTWLARVMLLKSVVLDILFIKLIASLFFD